MARVFLAQRRNPPAGRFVEVDGVRLHYMERGEGPPLVMLHGQGGMVQELALSPLFDLLSACRRCSASSGRSFSATPSAPWWRSRWRRSTRLR